MAMLKLCKCGSIIDIALSTCDSCTRNDTDRHKSYDKYKRDKQSTNFYRSRDWDVVRRASLSRDKGLCVHCLQVNKITKADVVDHIIPIKVDWSLRLTLSNTQSLCHAHHNKKTADDRQKYNR